MITINYHSWYYNTYTYPINLQSSLEFIQL